MTSPSTQHGSFSYAQVHEMMTKVAADYNIALDDLMTKYVIPSCVTVAKGKRGRKRKHQPAHDDFVEMEEFEYEGSLYLMDNKKNIYTYDVESPVMIGNLLVDGTVKFLTRE